MPIRDGYAKEVCIVTSGEMMSLYAANNIAYAVNHFGKRNYAKLKGLILNKKNIEAEEELVKKAADEIGTSILFTMERNPLIQQAENLGKTVVSAFPESLMAKEYGKLAALLMQESRG